MTVNQLFPQYLHNIYHSCFSKRLKEKAWLYIEAIQTILEYVANKQY